MFRLIKARFTRQFFWHGTCLNLAPVPKIFGPAPSIFVVQMEKFVARVHQNIRGPRLQGRLHDRAKMARIRQKLERFQ